MQTSDWTLSGFQVCEIFWDFDFDFSSQSGKEYLQNLTSYFRTGINFLEELQLSPDSDDDKSPPASFRQTEALYGW